MKTQQRSISIIGKSFVMMIGLISIALLMQSCYVHTYVAEPSVVRHEAPPSWAPAYENVDEVHYYYLPDIEVYYDVWRHEYVYMNQGNWIYSSNMPSYYSNYNVNDAFVVVLDRNANDPWRQHRTYVTQYPKYYYQTRYNNNNDRNNNGRMRGFNENAKTVIYHNAQNSGGGRSENPVRTPNTQNSRSVNQPTQSQTRREPTNNNQYQRTYTPASNQTAPARTRNEPGSQPTNSTNQPNSNPPATPPTRRVTRDNTSTPASTPVVRDRQIETKKPVDVAPERTRSAGETRAQPGSNTPRNNSQPANVQQNTSKPQNTKSSSDAQKKDDNKNSRTRR